MNEYVSEKVDFTKVTPILTAEDVVEGDRESIRSLFQYGFKAAFYKGKYLFIHYYDNSTAYTVKPESLCSFTTGVLLGYLIKSYDDKASAIHKSNVATMVLATTAHKKNKNN